MRITAILLPILGFALCAQCASAVSGDVQQEGSALECVFEDNALGCLRKRLARDLDNMELQVAGKIEGPTMSEVMEDTGKAIAEAVSGESLAQEPEEVDDVGRNLGEARKKKFGKKKKGLSKLFAMAMLMKSKLGLMLQAISLHMQMKFFVIAIISLLINASRFWLDLKKNHHPQKVIYYEHAQHQHHYDHDDHDSGYWGRSSDVPADQLAYNAYGTR